MNIKEYRENLKTRKEAMTQGILSLVKGFEEETGCCVQQINLVHTDHYGVIGHEERTVNVFADVNVLGDQD